LLDCCVCGRRKRTESKDNFKFFGFSKLNNEVTIIEIKKVSRTDLRRHFYKGIWKFGLGHVNFVCLFIREVVMSNKMLGK
jgi:hypothetical protein